MGHELTCEYRYLNINLKLISPGRNQHFQIHTRELRNYILFRNSPQFCFNQTTENKLTLSQANGLSPSRRPAIARTIWVCTVDLYPARNAEFSLINFKVSS